MMLCASEFVGMEEVGRAGGQAEEANGQNQLGSIKLLHPAGNHDARIPKETLRRQEDLHHPGCALSVHLYLHQDLGKGDTRPGHPPTAQREANWSALGGVSSRLLFPWGRLDIRGK